MTASTALELTPVAHLGARDAADAVAVLQAVADPTRWAVLELLGAGTACVCRIQAEAAAEVAPNLLSYHLRMLRESGLVTTARRGRWVDYTLAPDAGERMARALPGSGG